jgi:hypothetical protein
MMKTETALDPNSYFRLTLIVPAIALIFWETDLRTLNERAQSSMP